MALGRCPYFRICARLKCLATSGRSDFPAPSVVRCQDAVVAGEIDSRFRHKSSQTPMKLLRKDIGHMETRKRAAPVNNVSDFKQYK